MELSKSTLFSWFPIISLIPSFIDSSPVHVNIDLSLISFSGHTYMENSKSTFLSWYAIISLAPKSFITSVFVTTVANKGDTLLYQYSK